MTDSEYQDLWICGAFRGSQSSDGWGVEHYRVRQAGNHWVNERGQFVSRTNIGIGIASTRVAAVQSYLAYLKKLCDEARHLLEQREASYRAVAALGTADGTGEGG